MSKNKYIFRRNTAVHGANYLYDVHLVNFNKDGRIKSIITVCRTYVFYSRICNEGIRNRDDLSSLPCYYAEEYFKE